MKYTLKEWQNELLKRFGKESVDYKFICPACGKVSSGQEYRDAGASPNDMYQTCIGRHTGKGSPDKATGQGCNWAAFGLFGTLSGGDVVVTEDGKEVNVFSMADATK